jgi:protein TonB
MGKVSVSSRAGGRWRWFSRSGSALLTSAAVHAAVAVTAGGVLAGAPRPGAPLADRVEIDLAPVELAENVPALAATSPLPSPAAPVHAHPRPRRRILLQPTAAIPVASGPAEAAVSSHSGEPPHEAPRFAMNIGTVATGGPASSAAAGAAAGGGGAVADAFGEGDVNQPARLLAASPVVYPAAARTAEIEINLPVEIVVDAGGRVTSARALSRAGYGLDEAALRAIRNYRFSPAVRAGRSVPVRMRWMVEFRLR